MKKKLFSLALCVCLLLSLSATGVSAADPLSVTVSYGITDGANTIGEAVPVDADGAVTIETAAGIPYQLFTIDVSGVSDKAVTVAADASTVENERLALKAYNVKNSTWDTLATAVTSGTVQANIELATYAKDGKVQMMLTPDYVGNGSNRLIWSTDQQHYTKFKDLHDTYYGIHEYMVKEYQEGRTAYVINTGDIVDDTPGKAVTKGQWEVANKAFKILDDANVPYGIVTGNHDVGDYPANLYVHYLEHFNKKRYEDRPWYGTTPDDNRCHYDLVTVGNVDFLFVYFGYGVEDQQATLDWADEVLSMYPHRTAVLCTHQYTKPSDLEHAGRADILHNVLVTKHENVKMVLSGHYSGAAYKPIELEDGRVVHEVIADYQFVQKESEEYYKDHEDPGHYIGSVFGCNGEGYIRDIVVEGNAISMSAFSPITGGVSPFGLRDDVNFTVDFAPAKRQITVRDFAVAAGDAAPTLNAAAETTTYYADSLALTDAVAKAEAVTSEGYTAESVAAFNDALNAARNADKGNVEAVRGAYTTLMNAKGALEENVFRMNPDYLTTVHEFDLDLSKWENADGPASLTKSSSYLKAEQLEDGGMTFKKSARAANNWPKIKYTEPVTFTPEDEKIYLYLDMEAGSTWSMYPMIIQDGQMISVDKTRLNYIIEGSYLDTMDAGAGNYVGVFDVTQAFIDMGVDLTEELTISMEINAVPGPVTIRKMSILTGEYVEPAAFPWLLISLIAGGVIVAAAVIVTLIVMKKKKTEN